MFDLTHTKKPDFIHLVLIIAVVCLALGAITPSASAVDYEDLTYSSDSEYTEGLFPTSFNTYDIFTYPNPSTGGNITLQFFNGGFWFPCYYSSITDLALGNAPSSASDMPMVGSIDGSRFGWYFTNVSNESIAHEMAVMADFLYHYTNYDPSSNVYCYDNWGEYGQVLVPLVPGTSYSIPPSIDLILSLQAFAPADPAGMYVLSLDGSLLDTTYTVGINRYTDEFKYLIDSYAYTDGSGSYTFTGSRSLTLPIYYNSFTNMPYSYEVSVNVNDENGYLEDRYIVYWSDRGGLYDTAPAPVLPTPTPTPTVTFVPSLPVVPSDIIPDPESLNDTVNITGWYQDSGFEGNNITAPIYSGIRGWFSENLIPVIDFFLTPINYVATVISDSAETSTDGISYITEELGSYAAPFNTVGAYVVRLVPEVVWLVVFAALSIGYVILLIKISTGSIRDTIGRFLGGSK
ncbi:MAG: hypothetical protein QXL01_06725 [Thermoplasmatales archaeon]